VADRAPPGPRKKRPRETAGPHLPLPKGPSSAAPSASVVENQPLDADGGAAIVAFPGRGLASTLAASYLAEALGLRSVGRLDCTAIPSMAIVEAGEVVHPVRLLFGLDKRTKAAAHPLVMFLSEIPLEDEAVRSVASAILDWCHAKGIKTLISTESAVLEDQDDPFDAIRFWGVANRPSVNARLKKAGIPLAKEGIVAGITGAILDQALESRMEVVAVIAVGQGLEPDVRTASHLVDFLAKFLGLPVKLDRLHRETERFEKHLKEIERRRLASKPPGSAGPHEFV